MESEGSLRQTSAPWNTNHIRHNRSHRRVETEYEARNSLYAVGMGLNAAGFVSSVGEYSNVINGSWRGVNGKWNSLEWGGNQWTGVRANALSKAGYFKLEASLLLEREYHYIKVAMPF